MNNKTESEGFLSDDEPRHERASLERQSKTHFGFRQQSQPPAISGIHVFAIGFCRVAITILLIILVFLLGIVLSKGGNDRVHLKGSDFKTYPQQAIHASNIEGTHDHEEHVSPQWRDCGSSITEARAKGCVYDVILVAWLQPDCFDSELHEAYLSENYYPFWLDRSLEMPTTLEEVRLGNHATVYSSAEFHLAHCAYFMEQSVRGFRKGGMVDNVTLDNEHTEHCARSLRDHWLPEMGFSPLHMDFHSCGIP